jgi:hypothetical protein
MGDGSGNPQTDFPTEIGSLALEPVPDLVLVKALEPESDPTAGFGAWGEVALEVIPPRKRDNMEC